MELFNTGYLQRKPERRLPLFTVIIGITLCAVMGRLVGKDMKSVCAMGILVVILCAIFMLKSYLMKVAYSFCEKKNESSHAKATRWPYQVVLTLDCGMEKSVAGRVQKALEDTGNVRTDVGVFNRQIMIHMEHTIDDETLRSAVEGLGPYTVIKIERGVSDGLFATGYDSIRERHRK